MVCTGRSAEGYAEVTRPFRVPFGAPDRFFDEPDPEVLVLEDDPRFDVQPPATAVREIR